MGTMSHQSFSWLILWLVVPCFAHFSFISFSHQVIYARLKIHQTYTKIKIKVKTNNKNILNCLSSSARFNFTTRCNYIDYAHPQKDTPWIASQEKSDLTSRHVLRNLITQACLEDLDYSEFKVHYINYLYLINCPHIIFHTLTIYFEPLSFTILKGNSTI